MKRASLLAFVGLLIIGTAAGTTISEIPVEPSDNQIQQYVDIYNNNTEEVPSFVGNIIGDQKINLHYENDTYGINMSDLKVENVTDSFNQSSLEVWVEKEDIVEVANASDPREELEKKLDEEEIRYQEHGFLNKVTFGAVRVASRLGIF